MIVAFAEHSAKEIGKSITEYFHKKCTSIEVEISRIYGTENGNNPYGRANTLLVNEINNALKEYWLSQVPKPIPKGNPFAGTDLTNYKSLELITLDSSIEEFPITEGKAIFPCYGIESKWHKRKSMEDAPNPKKDKITRQEKFYLLLLNDKKPSNDSQEKVTVKHYEYFDERAMRKFDHNLQVSLYNFRRENPKISEFIEIVKTAYINLEVGSYRNSTVDRDTFFAEERRKSSKIDWDFIVRSNSVSRS